MQLKPEDRWDVVVGGWYKDTMKAVMTGDASRAIYTVGQMGLVDPEDCDHHHDWKVSDRYRQQFVGLPEDHWDKWLHRNHAQHNATVWRICHAVRPGFIKELADALREDMARGEKSFFCQEYSQAKLDGFFNEDPPWLGPYRPGAKAA